MNWTGYTSRWFIEQVKIIRQQMKKIVMPINTKRRDRSVWSVVYPMPLIFHSSDRLMGCELDVNMACKVCNCSILNIQYSRTTGLRAISRSIVCERDIKVVLSLQLVFSYRREASVINKIFLSKFLNI